MVYRQLIDATDRRTYEIEAVDQEFDPNFHQAVMQEQDEEKHPVLYSKNYKKAISKRSCITTIDGYQ